MCGGGKGVQQTSQQTAFPSWPAAAAYTTAMDKISQATSQPFQKYSSDPNAYVAPLTSTQTGAIQNVTGLQGMTQPYYQTAGAMTLAGASPVGRLTSGQIQEYMNPYMAQVVDPVQNALRQQFGMQLSQQQAEAIRGGAFGGDRSGLQRQALRGQQGLALGQALSPLYQTGYGQALQTAQGQQGIEGANLQRMLGAGAQLGGLGTAAQQAALQQASAQLQAGTLQQQTETAQKQALYNEFQKQRMYPLQTAQLYAQAAGALGPLMGSTSMGYQQMPFFGGFAADGGAINGYDQGLGAARMGGAVDEPGDYSRGGYAYGGDAGFEDIVSQQRAGIMPRVEDVEFPVGSFQVGRAPEVGALPERRQGIVERGLKAAISDPSAAYEKAKGLGSGLKTGYKFLSEGPGALMGFADGGDVEDNAMSDLLSHPIQVTKPQQTQQAPQQQKSGLGNLLKAGAGLAANYFLPGSGPLVSGGLSALGMADGGRTGYADGGTEDEMDAYLRPLARIESGGQKDPYSVMGPQTKYGRALGKYQIMEGNVPQWTKAALGRALTKEEFLSNPQAQEATAKHRFGQYLTQAGTPEGAAGMWFGGPDYKKHMGARDVLGTSIPQYMAKYKAGLGGTDFDIPKGDPRREMMAMDLSEKRGAAAPTRKEPGFVEGVTEHPERLIVPVLQGLGAMAASKNRYALGALAEGLGAGAGSYLETGKALEEQRKMHEEADESRARGLFAGAEAMKTARDLPIWVDPMTGQRLIVTASGAAMDLQEYLQHPVPFMGADSAASIARGLGLRAAGASQAGYAPEGGVMPTGLSAADQAGVGEETPGVSTARGIGATPPAVTQPPILPTPKPIAYSGVNIGEAAQNAPAQERALVSTVGGREALEASREIKNQINQQGRMARAQALYNGQAAQIIAEAAAAKGFEAMGAGSPERARIINGLNTIARGMGLGDGYFGENESRQQMLEKLNAIKGESTVVTGGQKALGSLELVIGAMPGAGQTIRSGTFNAASNLVQNQRLIDYQNYANAYGQRTSNLYNNVEDAFDSDNSRDRYAREEAAFEQVMKKPNGAKILSYFLEGKKPDGSKATKEDIDKFFMNNFDLPGMSRYFMGARRG